MAKQEEAAEAMFWAKERNKVRCNLCARRCLIPDGKMGFCLVRENRSNKLYTLNYGKLVATHVDPVEKKPLFHFYPGATTFSIACRGCNFRCQFCQNWQISHDTPSEQIEKEHTPEEIVRMAEKNNCRAISYTYTEPTIYFEFAFRTAKLAHRGNIKNIFVTNGYIAEDAVKKIAKYLDAATVNFKGSGDPETMKRFSAVADTTPMFECLKQMKKQRIHIEITNLIIPQVGDNIEQCRRLAQWVSTELGSEIPFHVLQFHPDYKLTELPLTPVATLERCIEEARKTGLRHVYIGNVPGHVDENTYCYNCRELLIERAGGMVKKNSLLKDRCPNCGVRINVVVD